MQRLPNATCDYRDHGKRIVQKIPQEAIAMGVGQKLTGQKTTGQKPTGYKPTRQKPTGHKSTEFSKK